MTAAPTTTDLVTVPLDRLISDPDDQPRIAGLLESHIRLLMEGGADAWPPLLVRPNPDGAFSVIDGAHRLEAARRLNVAALPCLVSPEAGYGEAIAANLRHGLPLAIADRKEAARWWTEQDPNLSLREIGRRCGLSDKTAKKAIESGDSGSEPAPRPAPDPIRRLVALAHDAYSGRHGRSRFGFGGDGNPRAFRQAIEAYDDDDRQAVARALSAFGAACVEASRPFISGDHR